MKSKIYIHTGEKQSGKSTALWDWAMDKPDIKGFVTMDHKDGIRYITDFYNKVTTPYASKIFEESAISIGRWYIKKGGLEVGINIISNYDIKSHDILVIDEIGSLEMKGEGYTKAMIGLMKRLKDADCEMIMIIVVRNTLVEEVIAYFDLENVTIISNQELSLISL
jgi:nucleoside-triphosphatase THEP1